MRTEVLLLVVGCGPASLVERYEEYGPFDGETGPEGDVQLVLTGEATDLDPPGRGVVVLFGHDVNLADASATPVEAWSFPVPSVPLTVGLSVPAEPHTLIRQGSGPVSEQDAGWSFGALHLDEDGDGDADWVEDFEGRAPASFEGALPAEVEIAIRPVR